MAGMEVPVDTPMQREREEHRRTLYDVVAAAQAFYRERLAGPGGVEFGCQRREVLLPGKREVAKRRFHDRPSDFDFLARIQPIKIVKTHQATANNGINPSCEQLPEVHLVAGSRIELLERSPLGRRVKTASVRRSDNEADTLIGH